MLIYWLCCVKSPKFLEKNVSQVKKRVRIQTKIRDYIILNTLDKLLLLKIYLITPDGKKRSILLIGGFS